VVEETLKSDLWLACAPCFLPVLLLLTLTAVAQGQYIYSTNADGITLTITGYDGSGGEVSIPSTINDLPVTSIGSWAFYSTSVTNVTIPDSVTSIGDGAFAYCSSLTNVTIPNSVTSIGDWMFAFCSSLTKVYFQGNAPVADPFAFYGDCNATVYYLYETTGWVPMFDGLPTASWLPQVQTSDGSFGVQANQFGFNINWANGTVVVVEACTNLVNPVWSAVGTNTLTAGLSYFSDPQWTNYPGRFYRLRSP
jgi:hypothetical protein